MYRLLFTGEEIRETDEEWSHSRRIWLKVERNVSKFWNDTFHNPVRRKITSKTIINLLKGE